MEFMHVCFVFLKFNSSVPEEGILITDMRLKHVQTTSYL